MTSNLGSDLIHQSFDDIKLSEFDAATENAKMNVMEMLKQTIRPEFLNRIDETILFPPLTRKNIKEIVQLQLDQLKKKLLEQDIKLVINKDAFDWIAEAGYDPFYGARPIKRVIQKHVMNELSKNILADNLDLSKNIVMDLFDGKIVFRKPINEEEEVAVS